MEWFLADPSLGYLRFVKEEWVHEVAMILGLAPLVEHVFGLYDLRPEWFRLSSGDVFVLADDETSDFGQSLFIVAAGVYDGEVTFRELYDGKDVESSGGQVVSRYRIGIAADSRLSAHQGFESWAAANFSADEEPVVEVPVVGRREVVDSDVSVQEAAEAVCVEDPDLVCSMAGYCYLWAVKPEHRLAAMKELKADPVVGSVFSLDPGWIQGPLALAQVAALQVVSGWHWFRDPFGTLEPVQEDEVVSATVDGGDWQRLIRPEFRDLVVSEAGEDPTWGRFLQVPAERLVSRLEAWACGLVYWDSSTWSKLKRVGSSMKVPWAGALAGGDRVGADPLFEFFRELVGFPVDERRAYEEGLSLLAGGFDPGSKEHQELFERGHRAVWMTSYMVKIKAGDTYKHAAQYAQSQVDPNSLRMLTVRVGEVVAVGWKPGETITNASCSLMAMFGVVCGLADISGVACMMYRLGRLSAEERRLLAGPWTGLNTTFRWAGRAVTVSVEKPGGEVCIFGVKVGQNVEDQEKRQWILQVAAGRGLPRYPYLVHGSAEACTGLTSEESARPVN